MFMLSMLFGGLATVTSFVLVFKLVELEWDKVKEFGVISLALWLICYVSTTAYQEANSMKVSYYKTQAELVDLKESYRDISHSLNKSKVELKSALLATSAQKKLTREQEDAFLKCRIESTGRVTKLQTEKFELESKLNSIKELLNVKTK